MRAQPWYGGSFAMFGPSYLGYAQWAIAAEAGPELRAMATQITASQFRDAAYVGGAFALESALSWTTLTDAMSRPFGGTAMLTAPRLTRRAVLSGRPVAELDQLSAGRPLPFFQDLLAHHADPAVPYWDKRDFSPKVGGVEAAVTMLGGWYDVFLPWQLKDYQAMRAAGRRPYLTIGPWYHVDRRHGRPAMADALAWFRAPAGRPVRAARRSGAAVRDGGRGVARLPRLAGARDAAGAVAPAAGFRARDRTAGGGRARPVPLPPGPSDAGDRRSGAAGRLQAEGPAAARGAA